MTPELTAPAVQMCRRCGSGAPADAHFCPQCARILSLGRHGDYFTFLGVSRKLNLDERDLDQRFRQLSRQFHPDYFHNADSAERRASLERSSYLNDAYRTLRQPVSRMVYLLELEGEREGAVGAAGTRARSADSQIPPSLLEEVFTLNEELDAVREERARGVPEDVWKEHLERARAPVAVKQAEHEADLRELAARWDEAVDRRASLSERREVLRALGTRMLERNYITNLLAGIERELSEPRT